MYLSSQLTWHLLWSALIVFLAILLICKTFLPLGKALLVSTLKTIIPFVYFAFFFNADWTLSDDRKYLEVGHQLLAQGFAPTADIFSSKLWLSLRTLSDSTNTLYYWWNALAENVFGYHYWAPVFLTVAVTALTGFAVYGIVKKIGYRDRHAQNIAILASLQWELIIWTSFLNLKDPLVASLAALTLLGILQAFWPTARNNLTGNLPWERISGISLAVASMAIVYFIRPYAPLFAVASVIIWLMLRGGIRYLAVLLTIIWIALAVFNPFSSQNLTYFSLGNPIYGLEHFILTPVPWRIEPNYSFLLVPAIINWAMLPLGVYGMLHLWRTSVPARLLIIYCILAVIFYALVPILQGPRHRIQILPFIAIFVYEGFRIVFRRILHARKWHPMRTISATAPERIFPE